MSRLQAQHRWDGVETKRDLGGLDMCRGGTVKNVKDGQKEKTKAKEEVHGDSDDRGRKKKTDNRMNLCLEK